MEVFKGVSKKKSRLCFLLLNFIEKKKLMGCVLTIFKERARIDSGS